MTGSIVKRSLRANFHLSRDACGEAHESEASVQTSLTLKSLAASKSADFIASERVYSWANDF